MSFETALHPDLLSVPEKTPLHEIQETLRGLDGVETCHVFGSDDRIHVVVHGGRLSAMAFLLDARLGEGAYDLTYTGK